MCRTQPRDSPCWKILVTSVKTKNIVLKHHLLLSMSGKDLNEILVVETVTNVQLVKNVVKRSWLTDCSNLWDSGLSGKSLAVNRRCSSSEWLERYHLYCVRCVWQVEQIPSTKKVFFYKNFQIQKNNNISGHMIVKKAQWYIHQFSNSCMKKRPTQQKAVRAI